MLCPNCQSEVPYGSIFCPSCGKNLQTTPPDQTAYNDSEPKSDKRTDRWYLKLVAGLIGFVAFIFLLFTLFGSAGVYISSFSFTFSAFFALFLLFTGGICLLIGFILSLCLKKVPGLFLATVAQLVISIILVMDLFAGQMSIALSILGFGYIACLILCILAMVLGFCSYPAYTKYKVR